MIYFELGFNNNKNNKVQQSVKEVKDLIDKEKTKRSDSRTVFTNENQYKIVIIISIIANCNLVTEAVSFQECG